MTFRFLLAEGMASLRRVAAASTIGAALTGIALAIVGGFALLALAYRADLAAARASATVEVFLDDGVDPRRAESVAAEITGFPLVHAARVRSRAEALRLFGSGLGDDTAAFKDDLPLPTTIQVELEEQGQTVAGAETLGRKLREIRDVEDVAFPSELVRIVDERSSSFVKIALAIGVVLSLSVIGVVANTAQLTVVSRRSVIRTMRLLGAERRWVLAPFVIQGFLIGLAGGTLAALALYGAWLLFPPLEAMLRNGELTFFPLLFPAAGAALGSTGAALASGYYLRQNRTA
jgi:cell division transport system permease protein